ncbi:MAG: hypothetical protein A2W23_07245 [Planctomycetes bacterium RBG_16_43_13]|nr:MAG: hypothetical protein A2W23_07245 [Planctomycetes bacterium RBG_16_43_13]
MNNILVAESIVKDYRSGGETLRVLKGVGLYIQEGEILSIVGPSGAGKSTLLHIMGFLDRPTEGDIYFDGKQLSKLDSYEQSVIRNVSFGFVFQMYHLLPELTVLENTLLPLMIRYGNTEWLGKRIVEKENAENLLDRVGLSKRMSHKPHQLSGGERQRVAIVRALVGSPKVVFCDEPTGNLDLATSREIQNLILYLNRELRKTFVVVTHDANIASIANRQLRMVDGNILSN